MPKLGEMLHTVSIQERTESKDSSGYLTPSWANIGTNPTVRASIRPLSAAESFEAGQNKVTSNFEVYIRDRTDVTSQMRLSATLHSQARLFEILGIERVPMEKPRWLKILCREWPGT